MRRCEVFFFASRGRVVGMFLLLTVCLKGFTAGRWVWFCVLVFFRRVWLCEDTHRRLGKVFHVALRALRAAMRLGVTTATDDGLSSTTQRHDNPTTRRLPYTTALATENDPCPLPSLILTSWCVCVCVCSTGWFAAETVQQKQILYWPLVETHTLDLLYSFK